MLTWHKITQGFQKFCQKLAVSLFSWLKSSFTEPRKTKNKQIGGKSDRMVTKLSTTMKTTFFVVMYKYRGPPRLHALKNEKRKMQKNDWKKIVKSGIWTRDLRIHSEFTMLALARVQFPSGRHFFLFSVCCFFVFFLISLCNEARLMGIIVHGCNT